MARVRRKTMRVKNHPFIPDGTRLCTRVIMAEHLGRWFTSDEIVHHINGDITDDNLENLKVLSRKEHGILHHGNGHLPQTRAELLRKKRERYRKRKKKMKEGEK